MSTRIKARPVITLAAAIAATYNPIASAGFPVYQLIISNTTPQDIFISFDGVTDAIYVPARILGAPFLPTTIIPFDRNIAFSSKFFLRVAAPTLVGQVVVQYIGCDKTAFSNDAA